MEETLCNKIIRSNGRVYSIRKRRDKIFSPTEWKKTALNHYLTTDIYNPKYKYGAREILGDLYI
jgi:hypothetical protein